MASGRTLHLIDGSGYIYRAFYAVRPLSTRAGIPTNAVVGFAKMLGKLLKEERPHYLGITFDPKGKTFRHEAYAAYKENRQAMPEDLAPQFGLVRELCVAMDIPILEVPGYEADDVIASLVRQAKEQGHRVVIVSADKDLMQLVDDEVLMFDPMFDKRYDPAGVEAKWGVPPKKIIDVLALTGDSSDNIPGVPKVGKKTAAKWVTTHGDVEGVIAAIAGAPNQQKLKAVELSLLEHREDARISRDLVRLHDDAPVSLDVAALEYGAPAADKLGPFLRKIEAYAMLRDFGLEETPVAGEAPLPVVGPVSDYRDPSEPEVELPKLDTTTYVTILELEDLLALLAAAQKAGRLAIDIPTVGDNPWSCEMCGLALGVPGSPAAYVPFGHRYLGVPRQLPRAQVLERVAELLADPNIKKVGHQLKFVHRVLAAAGIRLEGIADDMTVAAYVLDPGRASYTLDALARELLGHETIRLRDVVGTGKSQLTFDQVEVPVATRFAAENVDVALKAIDVARVKLEGLGLISLYEDLEMPLLRVLAAMEEAGIKVDVQALRRLGDEFTQRLATIEQQAHQTAGETFNLASTKQLGKLFFETLGYPVVKKTKTGYSTDHEVLETLARDYELPRIILEHRQLQKLKSTYIDALLKLARPDSHRVHTTYNQSGAATGRLSSIDPNLQNIPIRTEEGRRIRSVFIAEPGHVLISADYSQIELRILAHLSGDPRIVAAFQENDDIHRRTAMAVLTGGAEPSPEHRRRAKAVNFGIIYGLSAFGLSRQLGIPNKEASDIIHQYFQQFPGVRAFLDKVIDDARERGYVTTLLGRRRYLPDLRSRNRTLRSAAERVAMNTPMQGTAADLIKQAMIRIARQLETRRLRARLLLQVHDELVLEAPAAEKEEVMELVRGEMSTVAKLEVPLVVDVAWGESWTEAH